MAVGIIGGADGPMVLFTSLKLAPKLFVPISIIAYLYLSLTYAGYPYLIKLFYTFSGFLLISNKIVTLGNNIGKLKKGDSA